MTEPMDALYDAVSDLLASDWESDGEFLAVNATKVEALREAFEAIVPAEDEDRYVARFVPQAWIRDVAVEIDPYGETEWDATTGMLDFMEAHHQGWVQMTEQLETDGAEALDNDDFFKGDPDAPEWVREHNGPFSIYIRKGTL